MEKLAEVNMEVRKKLWEGSIPVKIDLAISDLISMEKPHSLYVTMIDNNIDNGSKRKLFILFTK